MATKPNPSPDPSTSTLSWAKYELTSTSQILQLTHHRNKNQHRLAKWYKQLSILRRNISKLKSEVTFLETAEKFSHEGEKAQKYVRDAREVVERRVGFMEKWVMEESYVSFSSVVKDQQFASTGLMLIGVLARIKSVLPVLGKEVAGEANDQETAAPGPDNSCNVSYQGQEAPDVGEVVSRDIMSVQRMVKVDEQQHINPAANMSTATSATVVGHDPSSQTKKQGSREKKKKRKRGDAFDDLFDSLI